KLLQSEDDEQQERAQEVIEALDEVDTAEYDLARIGAEVEADATALSRILERLNELAAEGAPDPKLDSVKAFVRLRLNGNLHDCGELLNYDLHWNPVRMIQRAGRINRLKALHEEVHVYNCFPDKELEDLLRIVRRLQVRIQDIDQSVGLDASVLGEAISEKSFEQLERIRRADATVVDELEQQA